MASLVITGGTLFDGTRGEVMRGASLRIEEGVITAVGPSPAVPRAHDVTVIDAGGQFVMPGMIDCHVHLELLTQNGLSSAQALLATTRAAAEALGIQDRTGILAPGYRADVIVVRGDPLADIRVLQELERITHVIKAGTVVARR